MLWCRAIEQGTETVHPCIGSFHGIYFFIKFFVKVFIPVIGIAVSFVETYVGIDFLGRTCRTEPFGIKAVDYFSISDSIKTLKAGDSVIDIEEGKNANCGVTVGVLTGAQTKEQLQTANPTLILENLTELKKLLYRLK